METKTCSKCEVEKPISEFSKWRAKCKECIRTYSRDYCKRQRENLGVAEHHKERCRKYYSDNKKDIIAYKKEKRRRDRRTCLSHYGGCCTCCGESRFEFLAIDHINGGGNKHRKEVGSGHEFIAWLMRNDYPQEFQVLCHNCNLARGFYGYCPCSLEK